MPEFSPLHDDLTFLSPLSQERAKSLIHFVAAGKPRTVLDIGCGWGELLLRTIAILPDAHGIGLDLESRRIEEAQRRATAQGTADRVNFEARDAREFTQPMDAIFCLGASQIWGPPVEACQPLDYAAALRALRAMLPTGGRLVYGEAVWSQTPTSAATAALGGRDDEFVSTDALINIAHDNGFAVEGVEESSLEEWDEFEEGFTRRMEYWLAAHPDDHPETQAVREQLQAQREGYLQGYRGILGMAYQMLVAH